MYVLIAIDNKYAVHVHLYCPCKRERVQFQVHVHATKSAVLEASPKYVLLYLLCGKNEGSRCKGYALHQINSTFVSDDSAIDDLELDGCVCSGMLKVCFPFLY